MGGDVVRPKRIRGVVRMSSHTWSIIKLEGYCLEGCDLLGKKSEFLYGLDGNQIKNPMYDPTYQEPPIPEWCPGDPCYECLARDCVHFSYCEYEDFGDTND